MPDVRQVPFVALLRDPEGLRHLTLREWDHTLQLSRSSNLTGLLAHQAMDIRLLETLPAPVKTHLQAARRLNEHQLQAVAWECQHLEAALKPLGIPVVLLKGAAYVMAQRQAAQGRLFGDIDLLVPQEALGNVEAALMLHGWSIGIIDKYDQRYYRQWMHELPPMSNQRRGTVVDVHHNILPRTSRHVPNADALMAESIPVPDTMFSVLAPCDMVIHSAVHLFHEGQFKNGLRDLCDLHSLMTEFSQADNGFWRRLSARAIELGLEWPLLLALRYTKAVLGTSVPSAITSEVQASTSYGDARLAILDGLYLHALVPDHPTLRTLAGATSRSMLFLRAHALRMPIANLGLHLGRKAILRLFKSGSRRAV